MEVSPSEYDSDVRFAIEMTANPHEVSTSDSSKLERYSAEHFKTVTDMPVQDLTVDDNYGEISYTWQTSAKSFSRLFVGRCSQMNVQRLDLGDLDILRDFNTFMQTLQNIPDEILHREHFKVVCKSINNPSVQTTQCAISFGITCGIQYLYTVEMNLKGSTGGPVGSVCSVTRLCFNPMLFLKNAIT